MISKGGTDIEDQCMGNYTTKMKCKRWPLVAFCYLLDAARVNSQSIYFKVKKENVRNSDSYKYGMKLVKALITPHIERREKNIIGLQTPIQHKMSLVLGRDLITPKKREAPIQIDNFESFVDNEHKRRCYMCVSALPSEGYTKAMNLIAKNQTQCGTCGKAVCRKHLINVCQPCARSFSVENCVPKQTECDFD